MKRAIYIGPAWENKEDGYIGYGMTGWITPMSGKYEGRCWLMEFDCLKGKRFVFYTEELYFPNDY